MVGGPVIHEFTLEEVTRAAKEARALVVAHERRSPTSKHATLGENDALFPLYLTLKRMFDRPTTRRRHDA